MAVTEELLQAREGRTGISLGSLSPGENLSIDLGLGSMSDAGTSILSAFLVVAVVLGVVGIGAGVIAAVAAGW